MSPQERGAQLGDRLAALGVARSEIAEAAGVDRGTVLRAIKGEAEVSGRTWARLEYACVEMERGVGVSAVIEYRDARVVITGSPGAVAETVRQILA